MNPIIFRSKHKHTHTPSTLRNQAICVQQALALPLHCSCHFRLPIFYIVGYTLKGKKIIQFVWSPFLFRIYCFLMERGKVRASFHISFHQIRCIDLLECRESSTLRSEMNNETTLHCKSAIQCGWNKAQKEIDSVIFFHTRSFSIKNIQGNDSKLSSISIDLIPA